VTLIGVKSKYGSGWGTSPGLINNNDTPKIKINIKIQKFFFKKKQKKKKQNKQKKQKPTKQTIKTNKNQQNKQ
jgi:hypothetical protein